LADSRLIRPGIAGQNQVAVCEGYRVEHRPPFSLTTAPTAPEARLKIG